MRRHTSTLCLEEVPLNDDAVVRKRARGPRGYVHRRKRSPGMELVSLRLTVGLNPRHQRFPTTHGLRGQSINAALGVHHMFPPPTNTVALHKH